MTANQGIDMRNALIGEGNTEAHACSLVMQELQKKNPLLYEKAHLFAEQTTYSIRHYGQGQFYCWAHHDNLGITDPWPASRFPKSVLIFDHFLALAR